MPAPADVEGRAQAGSPVALVARRVATWRWTGLLVGAAVAVLVSQADPAGRGLMLAPAIVGACVMVGVLAGELSAGRILVARRSASPQVRRVRDHLPVTMTVCVAASAIGLAALLVWTTATGSGGGGRSLVAVCRETTLSSGPWRGWSYSGPLAAALTVVLVLAAAGVRAAALRPRVGDPGYAAATAADDAVRRRSSGAVVAASGVLVAASGLGIALVTPIVMHQPSCAPPWWTPLRWGLVASALLLLVVLAWCALAVLVPRCAHLLDRPSASLR